MSSNRVPPFVSIIVPVYNSEIEIEKNIQSLLNQNYPKERYEIIMIDNGSTDTTRDVIRKYPVILLEEWEQKNSYTARNWGIRRAQGEIIAFTDADCIADPNWIQHGVDCIISSQLDSVGGSIEFTFSRQPTVAELADSLINLDNQDSIKRYGTAKTANFFTYKKMFQEIGMFNELVPSGGDGEWTTRAKKRGKTIGYCSNAIVYHPARKWKELLKKHVRVGGGSNSVWKARGKSLGWRIGAWAYTLSPFSLMSVIKKIRNKNHHNYFLPILATVYLCKIATAWGILKNGLKKTYGMKLLHLPEPIIIDNCTKYDHASFFESFLFLLVLVRSRRWGLVYYLLYAQCVAKNRSSILVLRHHGVVIGGSIFSDLPLRLNQFDPGSIEKMKELVLQGYCYGGSFFIDPKFRNQGFGTKILHFRSIHPKTKYYLTPSPRSRELYVRMGAKEYYQGRHTLFVMEGKEPKEDLVSIIIPTYNRSAVIGRAIESVLRQTYTNWELVIVDDGSFDNTVSIVDSYMCNDQRIRLIRHTTNQGISKARNTGIIASHGNYIAFLDSDDCWFSQKLEKQIRIFYNGTHQLGLVTTGVVIVNDVIGNRKKNTPQEVVSVHSLRIHNDIGSPSRVVIKRECIDQCGLFNENLHVLEDRDMWMRIAARYDISSTPELLVEYHESVDSISRDTHNLIAGYKKFWDMYHINPSHPGLYSIHCRSLGHRLCRHGALHEGRFYLRQSLYSMPNNYKSILLLILSWFGERWYRMITFYFTKHVSL